jgi:hypothetical protein
VLVLGHFVTLARTISDSVPAPWNKHTQTIKKSMAVHYSCAPDDGCMWHPKHVEQKTLKKKNIVHPVGFE